MIEEAGATTETAKSLGIGASTLRKYAAALEERGYRFERAANKSRLFKTEDVECIERLMMELREHNMPLADAVVTVLANDMRADNDPEPGETSDEMDVSNSGREGTDHEVVVGGSGESASEAAVPLSMPSLFPEVAASSVHSRMVEGLGQLVSEVTHGAVEPKDEQTQLQERVNELEAKIGELAAVYEELLGQMDKQQQWMNDKLEEERDRELVTNLRSYQGRQRKSKGVSLRMLFGLLPKKHKEA